MSDSRQALETKETEFNSNKKTNNLQFSLFPTTNATTKIKLPDDIPDDVLQNELLSFFSKHDAATVASAIPPLKALPEYGKNYYSVLIELLHYTSKGNFDEAEKLVAQNNTLSLSKTSFTEEWCDQRDWKCVSSLEIAAFFGDTQMVDMFLQHLNDSQSKQKALQQLSDVQEKGIEGKPHLSVYQSLLQEYKKLNDKCIKYERNYKDIPYFRTPSTIVDAKNAIMSEIQINLFDIGREQRRSTPYFIQWLCSGIPLDGMPTEGQPEFNALQVVDKKPENMDPQTLALKKEGNDLIVYWRCSLQGTRSQKLTEEKELARKLEVGEHFKLGIRGLMTDSELQEFIKSITTKCNFNPPLKRDFKMCFKDVNKLETVDLTRRSQLGISFYLCSRPGKIATKINSYLEISKIENEIQWMSSYIKHFYQLKTNELKKQIEQLEKELNLTKVNKPRCLLM